MSWPDMSPGTWTLDKDEEDVDTFSLVEGVLLIYI